MESRISQLKKKMPEKIRQFVRDESYTIMPEEDLSGFENLFYESYQWEVDRVANGDAPPIHYNAKEKKFVFLSKFLANADPVEWKAWKRKFEWEYRNKHCDENESHQIYDAEAAINEPDEDDIEAMAIYHFTLPDLPYRDPLYSYTSHTFHKMTGVPSRYSSENDEIETDDYGWIEDRKDDFINHMVYHCNSYQLPRLPLVFESKKVAFIASKEEVYNFKKLLKKRKVELEALEKIKRKEIKQKEADIENNKLFSKEEKHKFRVNLIGEMRQWNGDNAERLEKKWAAENCDYKFPSALKLYPEEAKRLFSENEESNVPLQKREFIPDKLTPYEPDIKKYNLN